MNFFVKQFKKYFQKLLLITVSLLLFIVSFMWLQLHSPHRFHSVAIIFSQYTLFFTIFRWVLIVILVIVWPIFIRYLANKQQWPAEKMHFWLQQKLRIAGWLIIFELLVCENLLLALSKVL